MDPSFAPVWAAFVAGVFGIGAAAYGWRASRKASNEQAAIDNRRLESEISDKLIGRLETRVGAQEKRIVSLEQQDAARRAEIATMNRRLDAAMRRYRDAIRYVRTLLSFIAEHVPGETPPPPPEGLIRDMEG